ncbi:MAG: EAL domain-containing protein [Proteobacteria bacterium]|nr:EAL domain-containing protein [Pseudomonadota bacterium]
MSQPPSASELTGTGAHACDTLLSLVADTVPVMLAYYDARQLRCGFANQRFADFVGRPLDSLAGSSAQEVIDAETWQQIQPSVQRALNGEGMQHVCQRQQADGTTRVLEFSLQPHRDLIHGQQAVVGLMVLVNDISRHRQAEHALRQSEERMRRFAEATEEGLVFHRDGCILDANGAALRITGYTLAEVLGRSIFEFILPEFRAVSMEYTRRAREHPYELALRHKNGRAIPIEAVGKTLPQADGAQRVVIMRDITARREEQEHARYLAQHDTLTQLPNRRFLMRQLARAAVEAEQRQARMALLFFDVDHFKTVNDSLGHEAGDRLLCEMARRLQEGVGAHDFIARAGGDQFVVLLQDLRYRGAAADMADALIRRISAAHEIGGTQLSLSATVGISMLPEDGYSPDELLRHAAAAMQYAKEGGRGTHLFYAPYMLGQPAEALQQEHLLREAVLQDALRLHYQPQIQLATGRLTGFEALVRWQHPERGLLGPDEFIPLAESRGLVTPIGRWVLREACRQIKAWHDEGLPRVPVAVNVSAMEFRQRDIVSEIKQVLAQTGLAPEYLEIEITETTLMQHAEHSRTTLQELQALGVAVTVDDFGTGYSSLAYLKRYPLDKIKVDRSFVIDTPNDGEDVAIITAIVQLAQSLQLQSVAEGVETAEQRRLLQGLGCELGQGFGIAAPMDAQAAHAWLQTLPTMTKP